MAQSELEEEVIETLKLLGGENIPIEELSSILETKHLIAQKDIKTIVRDMIRLHKGIHYGVSITKNGVPFSETVSLDSLKPVSLPPNQNPFMK